MDAFGPAPAVVAELFERLRRNRVLVTKRIFGVGASRLSTTTYRKHRLNGVVPARGPMFGAAARAEKEFGEPPVLSEKELYGGPESIFTS